MRRFYYIFLTNILVIISLIIIFYLISLFGINLLDGNYLSLAIYSFLIGFLGSTISLLFSKYSAKKIYDIEILNHQNIDGYGYKEKLIFEQVINISIENGINIPEIGIYKSSEVNAFATGYSKNNSLVAFSSGLIDNMRQNEIEGVIAHEMAHILNGDMVTMTILQGFINTFVTFITNIITRLILKNDNFKNGFIGSIIEIILNSIFLSLSGIVIMFFSRTREYRADRDGSKIVGIEKMISTLEAIKRITNIKENFDNNNLNKLKMFNFSKKSFFGLFSSHPDINDRIQALKNLQ